MATTNKLVDLASGNSGDLTVTAGSSSSATLTGMTSSEDTIRLALTVDCYVRTSIGASSAVIGDPIVFAGSPEAFGLPPGHNTLSARPVSTTGIANWAVRKGA